MWCVSPKRRFGNTKSVMTIKNAYKAFYIDVEGYEN
jgi:hypothetical protein